MSREQTNQLRGLIARAVVTGKSDAGETQTIDVTTHDKVNRSQVEVLQPFGVASLPPEGSMTIVLAVGGDQSDLVALPVATPGKRLGNLKPGEAAIYCANGSRIHITADGQINIHATAKVVGKAPEWEIEGNVRIKGDVAIDGDLTVTGEVADKDGPMSEMRETYNGHGHPDASPPPSPRME